LTRKGGPAAKKHTNPGAQSCTDKAEKRGKVHRAGVKSRADTHEKIPEGTHDEDNGGGYHQIEKRKSLYLPIVRNCQAREVKDEMWIRPKSTPLGGCGPGAKEGSDPAISPEGLLFDWGPKSERVGRGIGR